jgi:hypothetical protein
MKALRKWLLSFKGAMIMACMGLVNLAASAYQGSPTVWFDVAFVLMFVWFARRAINNPLLPGEVEVVLTQDQKDRLAEADMQLKVVMREVEAECIATAQARAKAEEEKDD